jgi:hypothetical protein
VCVCVCVCWQEYCAARAVLLQREKEHLQQGGSPFTAEKRKDIMTEMRLASLSPDERKRIAQKEARHNKPKGL